MPKGSARNKERDCPGRGTRDGKRNFAGNQEINTLYHCLLADNRMEDIQKAIMDTEYQKELLCEYGIGE